MTDTPPTDPRDSSSSPRPTDPGPATDAGLPPQASGAQVFDALRGSALLRVLAIGGLILLLQIPIAMIRGVIEERAWRRGEAVREVQSSWGGAQRIVGPRILVPLTRTITAPVPPGVSSSWVPPQRRETCWLSFLPARLEGRADLDGETLHRGIFDVPVYGLALALRGEFAPADVSDLVRPGDEVHWERAVLVVEISEARAIQRSAELSWTGTAIPFEPGAGGAATATAAIHVPLGERAREGGSFETTLALNGSESFHMAPVGEDTVLVAASDWPDPSFQGAWLPAQREVRRDGFEATWRVPALGRNVAQRWIESGTPQAAAEAGVTTPASELHANRFGVRFATPVDPYRMAERSAKYATLFLALTFGTLWLFEVLAGIRVHSVQYLLVGAAMCLFYLLETSLAEHLGFGAAYVLASSGVIGLIGTYAGVVLGNRRRSGVVGGVLVALYGYLFVLLTNQDAALLAGSLGLFVALALVMFLTRQVDWNALGQRLTEAARTQGADRAGA